MGFSQKTYILAHLSTRDAWFVEAHSAWFSSAETMFGLVRPEAGLVHPDEVKLPMLVDFVACCCDK